jgi:hypothetical protein
LCAAIVGVAVFTAVQLLQPLPALTFAAAAPALRVLPGAPPTRPGRAARKR